jgi:hypothetical protein
MDDLITKGGYTMEERLKALEKTARRQSMIITMLVLGLVATVVIAASPAEAPLDIIRTKGIAILNDDGRIVAALTADEYGGALNILTHQGGFVASLGHSSSGDVRLFLGEPFGKGGAVFGIVDGGAGVFIKDAQGTQVASLSAGRKGGHLILHDATGKLQQALP